jgi:uncharacterized protein (DUF58 family)
MRYEDEPISVLREESEALAQRFLAQRGKLTNRSTEIKLVDFRDYRPGDEPRLIDWKAYGRLGRPFVRIYAEEKHLPVYFCVDVGEPMGRPFSAGQSRLEYARKLVATMATLALNMGDRAGLATFDERLRNLLPPIGTRQSLYGLLMQLEALEPGPPRGLEGGLRRVCSALHERGYAVVLSPLDGRPMEVIRSVNILRRRGFEVLLVQLLDADSATDPRFTGTRPRPRGAVTREEPASVFEAAQWRDVRCVVADPSQDLLDALNGYMDGRIAATWAPLRSPRIAYEEADEEELEEDDEDDEEGQADE